MKTEEYISLGIDGLCLCRWVDINGGHGLIMYRFVIA